MADSRKNRTEPVLEAVCFVKVPPINHFPHFPDGSVNVFF
jgi:hypothetical protein